MVGEEEEFGNPPDWYKVLIGFIFSLLPIGGAVFFFLSNIWTWVLLFTVMALMFLFVQPYKEGIKRPHEVEVGDIIVLHYWLKTE